MFDLQKIGLKIVHELGTLIEQDVVVIDHNGFIIASTDSTRLNQFHEGSLQAMRSKQVTHMTFELTQVLRGVREGMVMPLIIDDVPIGVIGVTGKLEEIEKYGKIIHKITQLFVEDFLSHQEQERDQRLLELFLIDLLGKHVGKEVILQRANTLKIDTSLYSRVVVLQVERRFEFKEINELCHIQLIHPHLKMVQWSYDQLVFLVPTVTREHLEEALYSFARKIVKIYKTKVMIGVGNETLFEDLAQSYERASLALSTASSNDVIKFEEDLRLELLLTNFPENVSNEYLQRTIGPILFDDELLLNLEAWLHSSESLHEIAEKLHIHKNTLKYRLKKIEKLLNRELNERIHQVELILAIQLYRKQH